MQILRYIFFSFLLVVLNQNCQQNQHPESEESSSKRPNILFLLADDLGYGELGCYGQKIIQTPVLDSLAKRGMKFTNFYAGSSVCSPSRAVLMTGTPVTFNTIRGNSGYFQDQERWLRVPLGPEQLTLAEMLKRSNYKTGFVGKWHLDDANQLETWAHSRGFDLAIQEQWAMRSGGRQFTANMEYINGLEDSIYYDVNQWQSKDEFRTDLAIQYLDTLGEEQPFFLFMSFRAPHGHERQIGNQDLYANLGWSENDRMHAAKITLLDQQVGRLLEKLEEMGELNNTLVIFTSDNGPHLEGGHNPDFFDSNGPLRGYKRDLYEGGVRVPMIAYWNHKIKSGSVSHTVAGFQDFMPTLAEIAVVDLESHLIGKSLIPVFEGNATDLHDQLVWEAQLDGHWQQLINGGFRQAVRMDQWKGVRYGTGQKIELYDIEQDPGEEEDVAQKYPEIVEKVNQLFERERSENPHFPFGGVSDN